MWNRKGVAVELEMIYVLAMILEGCWSALIHHIVIDEKMWFVIFSVWVGDRS